ncbi:MAG: hypothetical protein M5R42_21000 [Rhodocyclaceae bacterium]|nr:hypothetical protein [Rhodocyclaceae bacterium]
MARQADRPLRIRPHPRVRRPAADRRQLPGPEPGDAGAHRDGAAHSIYRQFREILQGEGVELTIAPLVFEQIAELAIEYKVGARSLRGIFRGNAHAGALRRAGRQAHRQGDHCLALRAGAFLRRTGQPDFPETPRRPRASGDPVLFCAPLDSRFRGNDE